MAGDLPCAPAWWDYVASWSLQVSEKGGWSSNGMSITHEMSGTATLAYDAEVSHSSKRLAYHGPLEVGAWRERVDWDDPDRTGGTISYLSGAVEAWLWILPNGYGDDAFGILSVLAPGDTTFRTEWDDGCIHEGTDCIFTFTLGSNRIPVPFRPNGRVHADNEPRTGGEGAGLRSGEPLPRTFSGDVEGNDVNGTFKLTVADRCDDPGRQPGLPVDACGDIELPPPPPRPSPTPTPTSDAPVHVVPDRSDLYGPPSLAEAVLGHPNLDFANAHVSGIADGATPLANLLSLSNGRSAACSRYHADGSQLWTAQDYWDAASTVLDPLMLTGMLDLADQFYYRVMEIAGGQHPLGSAHFAGQAFDVDMVEGEPVASSPHTQELMRAAREAGASLVLGPGHVGHDGHVHVEFCDPTLPGKGVHTEAVRSSARVASRARKVERVRAELLDEHEQLVGTLAELRDGHAELVASLHDDVHPAGPRVPPAVRELLGLAPDEPWPYADDLPEPSVPPMPSRAHILDEGASVYHLSTNCPALRDAGPSTPYDVPLPLRPGDTFEGDHGGELPMCERCLASYASDRPVQPLLSAATSRTSLLVYPDRFVVTMRDVFGTVAAQACLNAGELYAVAPRGTGLVGRAKLELTYLDEVGEHVWDVAFYDRGQRDFAVRLIDALATYASGR
jgi:hypothetical protein